MSYILTIDFETHDPYLKKMGPGWAYGLLEILCMGYKINNEETKVTKDKALMLDLASNAHTIIAHNAQYDIGCLTTIGFDVKTPITFIDTVILAKLVSNNEMSYSLDTIASKYTKHKKTSGTLGDVVLKYSLTNSKDKTTPLARTKATNYAKTHMKEIYELEPDIFESYCKMDVDLCFNLYQILYAQVDKSLVSRFSNLLKLLIKSRLNGTMIDSEKLYDIKFELQKKRDAILSKLILDSGNPEFNPLSTNDIAQVLLKNKVKIPTTPKGNLSIVSKWLEEQKDPICQLIVEYRVLEKLSRDFCDNILEMQSVLSEKYRGKIYPTFNILGAETGRFSCSGPNLQQIPNAKKHKELGALIRSCYVVPEGKLYASCDYSAQEPRLQVHYAKLLGAEGADLLALEYNKDPNLDLHKVVANITNVSRNEAKKINLGIAYGMGIKKLSESLGLSMFQAKPLLEKFHGSMPYLKQLDAAAKKSLKDKGYIKTIGGRKLKLDEPFYDSGTGDTKTFEYKALNKLIQGSGADQIIMALIALDKAGFKLISSIHDEINLEVSTVEEALRAKKIMEEVLKLEVPVVAGLTLGTNWGNGIEVNNIEDFKNHDEFKKSRL